MRLLRDRRGATAVEYGLILAVAMLIIIAAAELLGIAAIDNFDGLAGSAAGGGVAALGQVAASASGGDG